jgi:hypothetical protein
MSDTPILEATAKALYREGRLSMSTYHYLTEAWRYSQAYLDTMMMLRTKIQYMMPPVRDTSSVLVLHGKVVA